MQPQRTSGVAMYTRVRRSQTVSRVYHICVDDTVLISNLRHGTSTVQAITYYVIAAQRSDPREYKYMAWKASTHGFTSKLASTMSQTSEVQNIRPPAPHCDSVVEIPQSGTSSEEQPPTSKSPSLLVPEVPTRASSLLPVLVESIIGIPH